jgi:integrase/recombinase XerD
MDPVCTADARERTASVNDVLIEFGQWLDRQRGLAPITITNYRWNVERFLRALPQRTQESVSLLDSGTVTAFMVQYCRDRNTNSAKSMARSVRSFLRFAHATGRTSVALWGGPGVGRLAFGVAATIGAGSRP